MPTNKRSVQRIATSLHKAGVINLHAQVSDVLKIDPSGPISDNAVAWSDYVIVTKGKMADLANVAKVAKKVRSQVVR